MSRSLIDRYTYGNHGYISAHSIKGDFILGVPQRQRELIGLARQQHSAQIKIGEKISRSQIKGAQIVATEVQRQTESLDRSISQATEQLSADIFLAAGQIQQSVELLGDRVCAELVEMQWQISQQTKVLEQILEVLRENRNNEARQFVQQGLRHYVNNELEEAEERFLRALDFDSTDYQVLMNLAFIELHKERFDKSLSFFTKALSLPNDLDPGSKARTLWAIARLFYTQEDYEQALRYAEQAFHNDRSDWARPAYSLGIYYALARDTSKALENIRSAIELNPEYYTRAIVDPDLSSIQDEVLNLITTLSVNAFTHASNDLLKAEEKAANDADLPESQLMGRVVQEYISPLKKARTLMKNPSYSDCILCSKAISIWEKTPSLITRLAILHNRREKSKKEVKELQEQFDNAETNVKNVKHFSSESSASANIFAAILVSYPVTAVIAFIYALYTEQGFWLFRIFFGIIGAILWPIFAIIAIGEKNMGFFMAAILPFVLITVGAILFSYYEARGVGKKQAAIEKHDNLRNSFQQAKKALHEFDSEISTVKISLQEVLKKIPL